MHFGSVKELIKEAKSRGTKISTVVIELEAEASGRSREDLWQQMSAHWSVMEAAMERGLKEKIRSKSGLTGGDAYRLYQVEDKSQFVSGRPMMEAVARAIAVAEINAAMGKIVAAPTAGSCGVLPAVLHTVAQQREKRREDIIAALFTAAGVGTVIGGKAFISGAAGGCQAEVGTASCMAAVAGVELAGGDPEQAGHAGAIALKNVLGLVCDPVAGLVEVPCIKRNAMGTANALIAVDMALAGVKSVIPLDDVISAMREVGLSLPVSLKETAQGGLANTPCARALEKQLRLGEFS
ncbi:MAG TPA: L-serine ammonia-lyase, iron-sulfur-dependent, subunit alpha [Clostridia bacterium]|nr:L-serine ammonia-lyase, iron-sulfur-dependent, subunit alpha [Clostridia bacterium]